MTKPFDMPALASALATAFTVRPVKPLRLTEKEKRSIACPRCGAPRRRACRGSRISNANTFGGGWGGAPDLERSHDERRVAVIARMATEPAPASEGARETLSFPVLVVPVIEGES